MVYTKAIDHGQERVAHRIARVYFRSIQDRAMSYATTIQEEYVICDTFQGSEHIFFETGT